MSALVTDANAVAAALTGLELDDDGEFAVALLGWRARMSEGSAGTVDRWRITRGVAPGRVVSTVDPDARHTRKSPENRRRVPGARGCRARDGDHHRREVDQGRRDGKLRSSGGRGFLDAKDDPCEMRTSTTLTQPE